MEQNNHTAGLILASLTSCLVHQQSQSKLEERQYCHYQILHCWQLSLQTASGSCNPLVSLFHSALKCGRLVVPPQHEYSLQDVMIDQELLWLNEAVTDTGAEAVDTGTEFHSEE